MTYPAVQLMNTQTYPKSRTFDSATPETGALGVLHVIRAQSQLFTDLARRKHMNGLLAPLKQSAGR